MGAQINTCSSTGPHNQIRRQCLSATSRCSGPLGPKCVFMCVCEHRKHTYGGEHKYVKYVMSHKNQRGHTSCWHDSGSRGEPHHHPAPWDNCRKARALWVMLLINSIQQTLRRYDYLSRTAPLSPAMLIIVVSLWRVFLLFFFLTSLFDTHSSLPASDITCYHIIKTRFYQLNHWWLSEAMSDEWQDTTWWR